MVGSGDLVYFPWMELSKDRDLFGFPEIESRSSARLSDISLHLTRGVWGPVSQQGGIFPSNDKGAR
jgi:hypothetical protein